MKIVMTLTQDGKVCYEMSYFRVKGSMYRSLYNPGSMLLKVLTISNGWKKFTDYLKITEIFLVN
jgi:hypothetical protein